MPARTRRAAPTQSAQHEASAPETVSSPLTAARESSPAPHVERREMSAPGLKFNESLSWRVGRPLAVAELIRRLETLGNELQQLDQEEEDEAFRDSFLKVARELADPQLLGHKDRGVRAWTARCIVDLLRLCAPNAPFTEKQLAATFDMITRTVLPALGDPSNAYNPQHMYVLESLATVKSILLVSDQPGSDSLIKSIFATFFDILSNASKATTGEQIAKAVNNHMTMILATLVDESASLPQEAVDMIVAQFLRADPRVVGTADGKPKKGATVDASQSTLTMRELPPAYNAAKTICNECPERMAHEVSKYFSDVIIDASGSTKDHRRDSADLDDLDDSGLGPNDPDFAELEKAHRLLRELWRACPLVLQNVVPQLEQELSAENIQLRVLATETLGDMASGVGAAGPPPPPSMDPAAYPPLDLSKPAEPANSLNLMTTPLSPQSFLRTHADAYSKLLGRRQDKSPLVRAAWTTAIGRVLMTSAGSMGLSQEEESRLAADMARMLNDLDERVRLAAVKAVGAFNLKDIVNKLGASGSVDSPGSVLGNLAERVKDRKHAIRTDAMNVLAQLWAAAAGEIANGHESASSLLEGIPSKILNTFYTNDLDIVLLMDRALFETLLPLAYPPLKGKGPKPQIASSQRIGDSQGNGDDDASLDPATIRTERILTLVKRLDERAKKIFFALSARQASLGRFVHAYLQACEDYNGGVMDQNEEAIKERLTKLISQMARVLPDAGKTSGDLWKFAKMHDRRSYQLIRFCMAPESDYRTMHNALKELKKRVETGSSPALIETLLPLMYRVAMILYNKSHVPAIMEYAKTDEKSLGSVAHDILTDISQRSPEVLKAEVRGICHHLQENAPSSTARNPPDAVESLKACAAFARKFPEEIPSERRFAQALTNFALHGTPPEAAKHAVSVIMAASNRKELMANELVQRCVKKFGFGSSGFLARLATLSRLALLAPVETESDTDGMIDIAIKQILLQVRNPADVVPSDYEWSNEQDEECSAKCWAIRILVNRVRSHGKSTDLARISEPVFSLLNKLVAMMGELSKAKDTPAGHRSRLRLIAARSLLKICRIKSLDNLFKPNDFVKLAQVAQDPIKEVRIGFLSRLKKYLGQNALSARFYVMPFVLATERDTAIKADMIRWIKSRATFFAAHNAPQIVDNAQDSSKPASSKVPAVLENILSRLLSLLAHHPDYDDSPDDLTHLANYIVFYLSTVANAGNVSLIYHIAQRVKASSDAIPTAGDENGDRPDYSKRLHILSDVATHAIRSLIDAHAWTLTSLPTRIALPRSLFSEIKDHQTALDVAETNFLDDDVEQGVSSLVRQSLRKGVGDKPPPPRKRKSETTHDHGGTAAKRPRTHQLSMREKELGAAKDKTKGKKSAKRGRKDWEEPSDNDASDGSARPADGSRSSTSARRKSDRVSAVAASKTYRERDDSEDDAEMDDANDAGAAAATASEHEDDPAAAAAAAADGGEDDDSALSDAQASEHDAERSSPPPAPAGRRVNGSARPAVPSSPRTPRVAKATPVRARPAKGTSSGSSPAAAKSSRKKAAAATSKVEKKKAPVKGPAARSAKIETGRALRSRA